MKLFNRKKKEEEKSEHEKRVEIMENLGIVPLSKVDAYRMKEDIRFMMEANPTLKLREAVSGVLNAISTWDGETKELMFEEATEVVRDIIAFTDAHLTEKKSIAILMAFLYSTISSHMDLLLREEEWQFSVLQGMAEKKIVGSDRDEFKGYG